MHINVLQIVLIALFIYLGSIGSIVGNTIGWYNLGRPLVASLIVGVIMGDVNTAVQYGLILQLAYLGSVTPGGAMAWDLSYSTYIGVAGALVMGESALWPAVLVGGSLGVAMWNLSYALNIFINRYAQKAADEGETKKMAIANLAFGQGIGFILRFVPAVIVLFAFRAAGEANVADYIPAWLSQGLTVFSGMMAALGMGILMSFLIDKKIHFVVFLFGFVLIAYFGGVITALALTVIGGILAAVYYYFENRRLEEGGSL